MDYRTIKRVYAILSAAYDLLFNKIFHSWMSKLRLIFHPVKRQDRSVQIQVATAVACVRHWVHIMITYSLVTSCLVLVGMGVGLPAGVAWFFLVSAPVCMIIGIFLMNRMLHLEKEFKPLSWRRKAVNSDDPELKRLFSLPFPTELRKWSQESLEEKLKGVGETSAALDRDKLVREITTRVTDEVMRRLGGA